MASCPNENLDISCVSSDSTGLVLVKTASCPDDLDVSCESSDSTGLVLVKTASCPDEDLDVSCESSDSTGFVLVNMGGCDQRTPDDESDESHSASSEEIHSEPQPCPEKRMRLICTQGGCSKSYTCTHPMHRFEPLVCDITDFENNTLTEIEMARERIARRMDSCKGCYEHFNQRNQYCYAHRNWEEQREYFWYDGPVWCNPTNSEVVEESLRQLQKELDALKNE